MSLYRELRPDPASLPIEIAMTSLEQSRRALTRPFGQAIVTNGAGGTSILGAGGGDGLIPWVDDSEPPSRPTGLSAASTSQVITVHWDGTLEYGLPADFHSIEIHIQPDGGDDTVIGTLRVAGDVASGLLTEGDIVDVWAVALDDAHDRVGEWTPNRSEASDVITLVVEPVVSQGQLRDKADEILAAADESVKAQIERVDTDLAATNETIDQKAEETLAAANAAAEANLNRVQEEIAGEGGKIDQAANAAYDRAKEYADGIKTGVDVDLESITHKIDKTAEDTLIAAKQDTEQHIEQVNKDIAAANQKIDDTAVKTLADANAAAAAQVAAVDAKVKAAQSKADANANAIEQTNQTVEANKQAVDEAQEQFDKTLTEHGSVLKSMDKDITQAKQDILANADAAKNAQTTADSKNTVYMQSTDPHDEADKASLIVPGDLWWQTSAKAPETYWTGEANNSVSVLVDHSGEIEHMWVWNGSRWNSHVLYAQDMLVNGSIVAELLAVDCVEARHIKVGAIEADKLAATALYGKVIKGGTFLTANERLIIDDAGLLLKDSGGNATITMLAGDGSATFRDVLIVGGTLTTPTLTSGEITGGTISGATVTGGTVQTVVDAHKGIKLTGGNLDIYRSDQKRFLRANESGLYINDGSKDVMAFFNDAGTWKLKLTGPVTSGGEISGATVTGGTVQTSAQAGKGIKLVGGNLDMYRADKALFMRVNESGLLLKDGSKTVLGFARTPRTYWEGEPNNSVSVLSDGWQLTLDGAIQSGGEITGAVITGGTVQTNAAANRGIKLKDNNLDMFTAAGALFLQANEDGVRFKDADGVDKAAFSPDANDVWNLRLTGMVSTGGAISGGTVTGSMVQTTASANHGVKMYSGDTTTGNLDVYRADGKLFLRANEDGLSVKDGTTPVFTFAKDEASKWVLSLKGAIQSGGTISGATVVGGVIRTNTQWESTDPVKKFRGLVITDGGMFAYKGNGKEEYSMAFTAATGELKLDGAVAANASLTGATINGGVVYGATVTTNPNYASTDPTLRDRGVWIKSNGLVAYDADGKVAVRIDATTGALYAADGVNTNGTFNIYDTDGNMTVNLGPGAFGIYKHGKDIEPSRFTYLDADNNHRLLSLWGENGITYDTQTGWDSPQIQSPCVDMGLQKSVRGGLLVYRGRVKCPNSGDNIISADTAYNSDYSSSGFMEAYGTNRSAFAVGFRNNTAQPCIVYIPANTRQLVAMNGPWDWVDLTGVTFGQ